MRKLPTDKSDLIGLGEVVRSCRERTEGLTQERVAQMAGITKNYVSDVERGRRNPTYIVLSRIVRALDMSWEDFGAMVDRHWVRKRG